MKTSVYIETTVIGYLTSRLREDVTVASHQEVTREWWHTAGDRFELIGSQLVVQECAAGDPAAARERLEVLANLTLVPTTAAGEQLAAA
jgi:hypothetical protein